jgi:adenylate cyclase
MNEAFFAELSAWLTQAGLAGSSENDIVSGFCDRCVVAGIPLGRSHVFIDTLHPVHEGRLFRWGHGPADSPLLEYGRTSPEGLAAAGSDPKDIEAAERWRRSPFYAMLQTGEALLRRHLDEASAPEFLGAAGLASRRLDRLCGDNQPFCRGGGDRRNGCRLYVIGDAGARWFQRRPDRNPRHG